MKKCCPKCKCNCASDPQSCQKCDNPHCKCHKAKPEEKMCKFDCENCRNKQLEANQMASFNPPEQVQPLKDSWEDCKEILYGFWEEYVNEEDGDKRDKIIEKYTGKIAAKIKQERASLLSELDKLNP